MSTWTDNKLAYEYSNVTLFTWFEIIDSMRSMVNALHSSKQNINYMAFDDKNVIVALQSNNIVNFNKIMFDTFFLLCVSNFMNFKAHSKKNPEKMHKKTDGGINFLFILVTLNRNKHEIQSNRSLKKISSYNFGSMCVSIWFFCNKQSQTFFFLFFVS